MPALKVHVRPLPLTVVAVAATLASALGGCTRGGGPATDGPLNSNGADGRPARGAACVPGRLGQPRTFGIELFTNHGHADVVLDRVALRNPHHERLVGSYAVPGDFLIGVVAWPPRYVGMPPTWKRRQPVRGFQLVPGKSFNMVLGVAATALDRASSQGMLVYYHDSAGSYVARDDVAMIIAVTKHGCA